MRSVVSSPTVGLEGFVAWRVVAGGGLVRRSSRGFYSNVITDGALDALRDGSSELRNFLKVQGDARMRVGSGTSPPTESDASLGNLVHEEDTIVSTGTRSGPSFEWWERQTRWEIPTGSANTTLGELGAANGAGQLLFRQRFLDPLGRPTTVTKYADEILQIEYRFRIYPKLAIETSALDVDTRGASVSTTVDSQVQRVNEEAAWGDGGMIDRLGDWGGQSLKLFESNAPPGDFQNDGPGAGASEKITGSVPVSVEGRSSGGEPPWWVELSYEVPTDQGNFGSGIGCVAHMPAGGQDAEPFAAFYDPRVDKRDTDVFTFAFRYNFQRRVV